GEADRGFKLLRQMIPGPDTQDYLQRGQLPVYIPNYYRGAYYQHPRTAGRSSQLFNTGTVSWVYRSLIEGTFGLKGSVQGLLVEPQLPSAWMEAKAEREFRGAHFSVSYLRELGRQSMARALDGEQLQGNCIAQIEAGRRYLVKVYLPG